MPLNIDLLKHSKRLLDRESSERISVVENDISWTKVQISELKSDIAYLPKKHWRHVGALILTAMASIGSFFYMQKGLSGSVMDSLSKQITENVKEVSTNTANFQNMTKGMDDLEDSLDDLKISLGEISDQLIILNERIKK